MVKIVEAVIGDIVKLKKDHACGGNEWEVYRLGMDIGLSCLKCSRKVKLLRYDFDRRFRGYVKRQEEKEDKREAKELTIDT